MNRCLQISKFESITLELWQFNDDYEVHYRFLEIYFKRKK